jgi:cytochrome c oxidase assembly factor CtaG
MSPTLDAFLRSWPFNPWFVAALALTAAIYLRGWLALRRRDPPHPTLSPRGGEGRVRGRWHAGQLTAFLGGLAAIFLALASPIEPFSALLLQVHMAQHLLLMMAAPPLLWLGAPLFPLLRGLPKPIRTYWVAPLFRSPALARVFGALTHPLAALPLFVAVTWLWHVPAVYEAALRSEWLHYFQHFCFLAAGLLFWYPVVRPYPSRPAWSAWLLLPYLLLADVQNTVLAALFTFADRVLYPYYAEVPRLAGLSALDDQSAAGVLMWVPGSLAFLLPLFAIGVRLLYGGKGAACGLAKAPSPPTPVLPALPRVQGSGEATGRIPLPLAGHPPPAGPFDLLRVPLLGRFLKWRHARPALQLSLGVLAGLLIVDGLWGPPVGPMNLAGVLPWIHWRGLVIVALLAAGNFFCLACPFLLPRTLARRWLPAGRSWPRPLRSKWLAVALLVAFLWAYEALALWDSPWWTAWIAVGYFATAFVIDAVFRGAAFCKYLCPIGQFNFVQSLVSPLEVKVRDPAACAACATKDCIRGRDGVPGCELHLYQPRKAGNLDCTFCLDCVHACPHDNIGLLVGPPGRDLWHDRFRSGVGRLAQRPDLAALALVLVFGAFVNAAGMVGPVVDWHERLRSALDWRSQLPGITLFYFLFLIAVPAAAVAVAAALGRWWGRLPASWLQVATRYAFALMPLGFGMWLAHYSFHFLTSYDVALPAVQRFAGDLGWAGLGEPEWAAACCRPAGAWLPRLEIVFLDLGLLLSLYTGHRIAVTQTPGPWRAFKALAPWALLMVLLFAAGVWIVLQPMQMRGTLEG